ncbi:MAG TPA: HD domain-containing protein, partial [Anaerolineales bacterium]|nr:HD domain-containing protein [Anaerolineales bacterium]
RRLANELGADYFDLDATRRTGRLLLTTAPGRRSTFDFASLRGGDLPQDLAGRDFTVNAMAIRLEAGALVGALIDPLGGANDLRRRSLRPCSDTAIADDPVRAVRAVRLAAQLNCRIDPDAIGQIHRARGDLGRVSPERLRDELFRLLEEPAPGASLRSLDQLGLLSELVPEVDDLRGLAQPAPHAFDAFEHSLATVDRLSAIIGLVTGRSGRSEAKDLAEAAALAQLGVYQTRLAEMLDFAPSFGRPRRCLLLWTALLHDSGKGRSRSVDAEGRIRFFGHETVGSRLAVEVSRRYRLSTVELAEVEMVVLHHMRPEWLEAQGEPTRRAVYRFYRATESTGPLVVLLSLADLQARYIPPVPAPIWERRVTTAGRLLQAWFDERQQVVMPPLLLTGDEIMRLRGLGPGPQVGRLIEALREAQAEGEVVDPDQAEAFVRAWQESDPA